MPIIVLKPDDQLRNLHKAIVECQKWIMDNYQDLQTKYPDEHIAVYNKEVIDHDNDLQRLIGRLKNQYYDIKHILIRFISKDKVTLVI